MKIVIRQCELLCLLTGFIVAFENLSQADSWGTPREYHWSSNGKFVLRVDWKQGMLVFKERSVNGFQLRWKVPYPKDDKTIIPAPVEAYITDNGQHVILRDQWHMVGYGKVLTFLGPDGKVVASYTLEQILTQDEILSVRHTVSSIWWSSDALFFFLNGQTQFAFITRRGTIRIFDVATGQLLPLSPALKSAVYREAIKTAWRGAKCLNPHCRSKGAMFLGILKDKASVPILQQLLNDPNFCLLIYSGQRPQRIYTVQLAAGEALVSLLGPKAVPLLDAKLPGANRYMTLQWIKLIERTGAAHQSRNLLKLLKSPDPEIRRAAQMALRRKVQ